MKWKWYCESTFICGYQFLWSRGKRKFVDSWIRGFWWSYHIIKVNIPLCWESNFMVYLTYEIHVNWYSVNNSTFTVSESYYTGYTSCYGIIGLKCSHEILLLSIFLRICTTVRGFGFISEIKFCYRKIFIHSQTHSVWLRTKYSILVQHMHE